MTMTMSSSTMVKPRVRLGRVSVRRQGAMNLLKNRDMISMLLLFNHKRVVHSTNRTASSKNCRLSVKIGDSYGVRRRDLFDDFDAHTAS